MRTSLENAIKTKKSHTKTTLVSGIKLLTKRLSPFIIFENIIFVYSIMICNCQILISRSIIHNKCVATVAKLIPTIPN